MKQQEELKQILIDLVEEMFTYGHFMSLERAKDLEERIKSLDLAPSK